MNLSKTDQLKYDLLQKGLNYVGTRGDTSAPICFVGEAPGADEDQAGIPFVGGAGREQDKMNVDAGILPEQCWFTNPYKTRPPENKMDRLLELGIPLNQFEEQFFEELNQHKPTFIVALGATALGLLCEQTKSHRSPYNAEITKFQGSLLTSPKLAWPHYVIPCLHPAFILRSWSDRVVAVLCLAKVAEESDYYRTHNCLQPLPDRKLIADPSCQDAIDFLRGIIASPKDQPVSIDIENVGVFRGKYKTPQRNRLPYVIGFAPSADIGMSIGLAEYERDKTIEVWRLIDKVLQTRPLIGQNAYSHDLPWLRYLGFSPNVNNLSDTLVLHHCLYAELSHKLDFMVMQFSREPYYKSEGHNWGTKDRLRLKRYNCKDVCLTFEVFEKMLGELEDRCRHQ